MRVAIKISKYYGAKKEDCNNPTHAFLDLLLGHLMVNLVMSATMFAAYAVDMQKALLKFFEGEAYSLNKKNTSEKNISTDTREEKRKKK